MAVRAFSYKNKRIESRVHVANFRQAFSEVECSRKERIPNFHEVFDIHTGKTPVARATHNVINSKHSSSKKASGRTPERLTMQPNSEEDIQMERNTVDRLEELKNKYDSALETIQREGVQLSHLHVQENKLFIQGVAPSEAVKNDVWNQIKAADSGYTDLTCELTVNPSLTPKSQAAAAYAGTASGARTYTVKPGDTLSKISEQFYGKATEYNKIFEANRDQLNDPNKISAGQELIIPS